MGHMYSTCHITSHSIVLCSALVVLMTSQWPKTEIWSNLKISQISETKEATPTKIGLHALQVNLYLHEFFEPILFFDPYSPWSEGKFWLFLKQAKRSHNSETEEVTPTKIGLHAFQVNLYLHEFFEPILFFDPHGYSPWSEGKFWPF